MDEFFQSLFGIWREGWNQLHNIYGIWTKNKRVDEEAIMSGDFELDADLFNPRLSKWIVQDIRRLISARKSNFDRIRAVEPHYNVSQVFDGLESYKHVLTKNLDMAQKLKAIGKNYMKCPGSAHLQKALRGFNLASSFVPTGHKLLIEICNLRSTVFARFVDMEGYQQEKALALKYAYRDSPEEVKQEQSPNAVSEAEILKKYQDEVIFKVHGAPSKRIPSASKIVLLKYSQDSNERSLVASEDIEPGTTIIVEDPYVAVFDNEMAWEFKTCFCCFKKIDSTVPCFKCVFAVYCSEECRDADFVSGHRFECPCLEYLIGLRAESYVRLSLKAVCKAGCAKLIQLMEKVDMRGGCDASSLLVPGIDPTTGVFSSNSYYTLAQLKPHVVEAELLSEIYNALTLTHILNNKSAFFDSLSPDQLKIKGTIFTFVAASILGNLLSYPYNAFAMGDQKSKDGLLTGMYPTVSMMNHSCDPNAFWVNLTNGKMAVITARQVKAGEEITISYGFDYMANKFEERLEGTTERYRFLCKCLACELRWPIHKDLGGVEAKWICSFCAEYMNYSREELIKKCTLSTLKFSCPLYLQCKNCKGIFPFQEIYPIYKAFSQELLRIDGLAKKGKLLEAITLIKYVILYFQHHLCPPSVRAIESQELLRDAIEAVLAKVAEC